MHHGNASCYTCGFVTSHIWIHISTNHVTQHWPLWSRSLSLTLSLFLCLFEARGLSQINKSNTHTRAHTHRVLKLRLFHPRAHVLTRHVTRVRDVMSTAWMRHVTQLDASVAINYYEVATVSRLLRIIGLFCKKSPIKEMIFRKRDLSV